MLMCRSWPRSCSLTRLVSQGCGSSSSPSAACDLRTPTTCSTTRSSSPVTRGWSWSRSERTSTSAGIIAGLLTFGMIGFAVTESKNPWDGFQWTLDILATEGSLAHPNSTGGQIVSSLLIVMGVGTLFYALVTVTEFFVSGHLAD